MASKALNHVMPVFSEMTSGHDKIPPLLKKIKELEEKIELIYFIQTYIDKKKLAVRFPNPWPTWVPICGTRLKTKREFL